MEDFVEDIDDTKDNNSDWEPPPPKKKKEAPKAAPVNKFADLPRRESRYRIAKNLDAVTRKAKQVYESSEMYVEQKVRRRKSVSVFKILLSGSVPFIYSFGGDRVWQRCHLSCHRGVQLNWLSVRQGLLSF